jgi:hypothetical protein
MTLEDISHQRPILTVISFPSSNFFGQNVTNASVETLHDDVTRIGFELFGEGLRFLLAMVADLVANRGFVS